ncbi:MAG: hypothetical protein ACKV2T_10620 [Kofleriaceae bacterium]
MSDVTTRSVPTLSPAVALVAWLVAALALIASGVAARVPPVMPAWIALSVAGWIVAYHRSSTLRAWADSLDLRALVIAHAIRLPIGALFLYEMSRGRLAPLFAERAGYGDIAIGALALVATLAIPSRRKLVAAFSWLGLADIFVALGTGMFLLFVVEDPMFTTPITTLPYPLIPAIVVPLVILSHVLVIARLARR